MKVLLCNLITIGHEFERPLGDAQVAWSMRVGKMLGVRTMLRIRGTVGDLPVDLTLELDDGDWARLGAHLQAAPAASVPTAAPVKHTDDLWQSAQDLLRQAGQLNGLGCSTSWKVWQVTRRQASACWCACATVPA